MSSVHLALPLDETVAACGVTFTRALVIDDGHHNAALTYPPNHVHGTRNPQLVTCRRCRELFAQHAPGFGFPLH